MGEEYEAMVDSGYQAFMEWDGSMNSKVGRRLPNYEALYVLWTLKALEITIFWFYDLIEYVILLVAAILFGYARHHNSVPKIVE